MVVKIVSSWFLLAGSSFLGDSGVYIYLFGRVLTVWSTSVCVTVVRHIRFLLVKFFSGLPPCVGYFL